MNYGGLLQRVIWLSLPDAVVDYSFIYGNVTNKERS